MTHGAALPAPLFNQAGVQQSAQLLRALGAHAAPVWAEFEAGEAAVLSQAIRELPVDETAAADAAKAIVSAAASRNAPPVARDDVWARMSAMDPARLAGVISSESAQVLAVILSKLEPRAAAPLARRLPASLAMEALRRLLRLTPPKPEALSALEAALDAALDRADGLGEMAGDRGVARIFDQLDSRAETVFLSALESAEPGAGERVRALMFTFEDLAQLNPAGLQTLLAACDRTTLSLALKGAASIVADAFFGNMTARAGDALRDDIAALGPVRRSVVDEARVEIIETARALVRRGEILSGDAGDEELVE